MENLLTAKMNSWSIEKTRDGKNCQFENCWFVHGNGEEKGVVQNSDKVQRLLSMMEDISDVIMTNIWNGQGNEEN